MSNDATPRFLEFFAGVGLVRRALEPTWACVWANDVSAKKGAVYRINFGKSEFVEEDVAMVPADSLPDSEMAWASFPCQDLSLAGWRRGMSASRSGTFWAFWRLMTDLKRSGRRPPMLVIENVVGLLYGDNFVGLCEAIAGLGMRFGAMVLDAKHFLPQSRPRVFLVAIDESVDVKGLTTDPGSLCWHPKSLLSAVSSLPRELAKNWLWWDLPAPVAAQPNAADLVEPLEDDSLRWRSDEETRRLLSMMSDVNRAKVEVRRKAKDLSVGFLYRRMRHGQQRPEVRFDMAGCLRTPAGGSSRQTVVLAGEGKVKMRLLTPREAARLMGADKDFHLPENYNEAYRAMGDGVAVPVVKWLSEHLLVPLIREQRREVRESEASSVELFVDRSNARATKWLSAVRV